MSLLVSVTRTENYFLLWKMTLPCPLAGSVHITARNKLLRCCGFYTDAGNRLSHQHLFYRILHIQYSLLLPFPPPPPFFFPSTFIELEKNYFQNMTTHTHAHTHVRSYVCLHTKVQTHTHKHQSVYVYLKAKSSSSSCLDEKEAGPGCPVLEGSPLSSAAVVLHFCSKNLKKSQQKSALEDEN